MFVWSEGLSDFRNETFAMCGGLGRNHHAGSSKALSVSSVTPEGLERFRRSNWKHGRRSAEAIAARKEAMAIRRAIKLLLSEVGKAT